LHDYTLLYCTTIHETYELLHRRTCNLTCELGLFCLGAIEQQFVL